VLEETGLNPSNLQLEITESAMLKNIKNTKRILTYLANLGIGIALDDFGTGYSSLSYLHELPIYTLKIDGSFVNRITEEDNGVEIVRAIVVLARNLRMKVVAEGIENYAQLEELCEMNCDYGQGYLFSRPVTANKTIELFDKPLSAHSAHTTNLRRKRLRLA
jgi:EAL domain-containing protein (putative c-di-GMP-specific phosphodiesterase class I)